jgi:catalase
MTTSNGRPIETLTSSETVGPRGPVTLQVCALCEGVFLQQHRIECCVQSHVQHISSAWYIGTPLTARLTEHKWTL